MKIIVTHAASTAARSVGRSMAIAGGHNVKSFSSSPSLNPVRRQLLFAQTRRSQPLVFGVSGVASNSETADQDVTIADGQTTRKKGELVQVRDVGRQGRVGLNFL